MSSCWVKPTDPASETFPDPDAVTQHIFLSTLCHPQSHPKATHVSRVHLHARTGPGSVRGSGQVLQLQTFPWGSCNLVWWKM